MATVYAVFEKVATLKAQRVKLQQALERLIDGFTEGLLEEDQFTARMDRTKHAQAAVPGRFRIDVKRPERLSFRSCRR